MKFSASVRWAVSAILALVLIAGSCSSSDDSDNADSTQGPGGTIEISGSSTVEPISVRVAELFEDTAPSVRINVDGPGTGDGFRLFCDGDTDISNASRPIQDLEAETCRENGISWTELKVGIDGIAVMTSENNNSINCVSYEELYALIGPESTSFRQWSDANDLLAEMGASSNLPSASLDIFGPGEESGTFDSFVELVLEDIAEERSQEATTRPDYSSSADDNIIIQGVQNSDSSLGWVGFAFTKNARGIKLLEIDGGDGCISPTESAIASGEYPISRPLFIYVNADRAAEDSAIQAFIDFYLSDEGLSTAVSEVGYVELDSAEKAATRSSWQN